MTHGARRRPGVPGDDLGIPTDPDVWPDTGSVDSHRFGRPSIWVTRTRAWDPCGPSKTRLGWGFAN